MLAQLGSTLFEIYPLNAHEMSLDSAADFAEKSVMGRRPTLEFMGEGAETRTISCRIYPNKFGGLSSVDDLHAQRAAGKALPYMRGDGAAIGWFVIERITEKASYLDPTGVGQVIEVEVQIKRADEVDASAAFSVLSGLL